MIIQLTGSKSSYPRIGQNNSHRYFVGRIPNDAEEDDEYANPNDADEVVYFLICTDPEEAYSHHKDYADESEYCEGLQSCIRRGFEVQRLPEDEALELRSDPCDYCYGHQF